MEREVVITGGRDYGDSNMIDDVLDFLKPTLVITGACSGADQLAEFWANDRKVQIKSYPYPSKHGKAGGPIRNRQMLDAHPKAVVVAFPGGRGTADCVRAAAERNRIVLQVHE